MNERTKRTLHFIARLIQIAIALVFIVAAASKALDPPAFVDQIAAYQIFPQLAPFGAWFFIIVECLIAGMLLVNLYPRWSQLAAGVLMSVFIAVTFYGMTSEAVSNCGCFGNIIPRTPMQTLIEDLVMLVAIIIGLVFSWNHKTKNTAAKHFVTGIFGVIAVLVIVFHLSIPADNLATQLKPGAQITSWPVEGLYENLNEGTHVVFLFSLQLDGFETMVKKMNDIAQDEHVESTLGLITDGSEQLTTLMFQYGTGFPAGALEPRFARNLYRTLPRTFIIHNGTVIQTWSEIPGVESVVRELRNIK